MNIDIRKSIHKNFENTNEQEIRESIESSIQEKDRWLEIWADCREQ